MKRISLVIGTLLFVNLALGMDNRRHILQRIGLPYTLEKLTYFIDQRAIDIAHPGDEMERWELPISWENHHICLWECKEEAEQIKKDILLLEKALAHNNELIIQNYAKTAPIFFHFEHIRKQIEKIPNRELTLYIKKQLVKEEKP